MVTEGRAPLFQEIEPPQGLFRAILAHIELARRRAARVRLFAWGSLAFVSALALIPTVQYAASEFYASGFYEYASLFFDSLSRGYWKEIVYSLTDSLPSFALLLLAVTGIALVWSLRHARNDARLAFPDIALPA